MRRRAGSIEPSTYANADSDAELLPPGSTHANAVSLGQPVAEPDSIADRHPNIGTIAKRGAVAGD